MYKSNLLDQLMLELIPFILKNLSILDFKKYCRINDIWKDKVIQEIHKRLVMDYTFIDNKITIKALINPKSCLNSISKMLAKKID